MSLPSFKPLTLADKPVLQPILSRFSHPLSGYSFALLHVWHNYFNYAWQLMDDTLMMSFDLHHGNIKRCLMQPIGDFGEKCQQTILKMAQEKTDPFHLFGISEAFIQKHKTFCSHFDIVYRLEYSDYIYKASDLAELKGEKYAKKRNLIHQACRAYKFTVDTLHAKNIDDAFFVLKRCDLEIPERGPSETRQGERQALELALEHFGRLGFHGVLIRIDETPAAFAIYEVLPNQTAIVAFERALRTYKGLSQIINQETAKSLQQQGIEFINREEDLGDPGLRQAKMSYAPFKIEPSYSLTFRRPACLPS